MSDKTSTATGDDKIKDKVQLLINRTIIERTCIFTEGVPWSQFFFKFIWSAEHKAGLQVQNFW